MIRSRFFLELFLQAHLVVKFVMVGLFVAALLI